MSSLISTYLEDGSKKVKSECSSDGLMLALKIVKVQSLHFAGGLIWALLCPASPIYGSPQCWPWFIQKCPRNIHFLSLRACEGWNLSFCQIQKRLRIPKPCIIVEKQMNWFLCQLFHLLPGAIVLSRIKSCWLSSKPHSNSCQAILERRILENTQPYGMELVLQASPHYRICIMQTTVHHIFTRFWKIFIFGDSMLRSSKFSLQTTSEKGSVINSFTILYD